MEWIILTVGLLVMAYLIFRPNHHAFAFELILNAEKDTEQKALPDHLLYPLLYRFFYPQDPFYSPNRGYIWDPYKRRWVRNYSGDGWLGVLAGIIVCLVVLWLLGVLGSA